MCSDEARTTFYADCNGYEVSCECGEKLNLNIPITGLGKVLNESEKNEAIMLLEVLSEQSEEPCSVDIIARLNKLIN